MKNLIIVLILAAGVFFGYRQYTQKDSAVPDQVPTETETESADEFNAKANIWNRPVTDLGLGINKLGGLMELSPNNRYLVFGGVFEEGTRFDNMIFVADLSDGRVWEIPGAPIGSWNSNTLLASAENDKIFITHLSDGTADSYTSPDQTFSGSFSPNGAKFVYNTMNGIRVIDLVAKTISNISDKQYDGAYAWMNDSNKIFGFKENPLDNLFEAGKGRVLAIWDTSAKTSDTNLGIDMPSSSIRRIEWIVPEKIARVNAGFDDGSFDYIVNLETKFVADLGETSGMLMSGVELDRDLGLIGMVGAEIDGPGGMDSLSVAKIVDQNGKTLQRRAFDDNLMREYVQVVNNHALMYLRKTSFENRHTDVIYLDFKNGEEKVLYGEDDWLHGLRVTKDKKHFILAGKKMIIMKDI